MSERFFESIHFPDLLQVKFVDCSFAANCTLNIDSESIIELETLLIIGSKTWRPNHSPLLIIIVISVHIYT